MSALKNTLRLIASTRQFSRSAITNATTVPEGYSKIKLTQAKFQKPDGLPVHLKGGAFDKILFGITASLCVVGVGMFGKLIFDLAVPKKPE